MKENIMNIAKTAIRFIKKVTKPITKSSWYQHCHWILKFYFWVMVISIPVSPSFRQIFWIAAIICIGNIQSKGGFGKFFDSTKKKAKAIAAELNSED